MKFDWLNRIFWLAISLFVLFKLVLAFKYHLPIWDESVYLGMGNYFASFGHVGLMEVGRPVLLPFFLGLFSIVGLSSVFWGELLVVASAVGSVVLLRCVVREWFDDTTGIITGLLLLVNSLFWIYSSYLLTGIPAIFLMLLSVRFFQKDKHFLAGLFASLAMMMRFPAGLIVVVIVLMYVFKWWESKDWKQFRPLLFALLGIIIPLILFFTFHYFHNRPDVGTWWHAIYRPILYATAGSSVSEFRWLYEQGPFYYFVTLAVQYPVTLLAIPGIILTIYAGFRKRLLLFLLFVLLFVAFSALGHKEIRYSLLFLPFMLAYSAYFLVWGSRWIGKHFKKRKRTRLRIVALSALTLYLLVFIVMGTWQWGWRASTEPAIVTEGYAWFSAHPVAGKVLSTDPVLAAYAPNLIVSGYYSASIFLSEVKKGYDTVFLYPDAIPCHETDVACQDTMRQAFQTLAYNYNLVHEYHGDQTFYIFSKVPYLEAISNVAFIELYDLAPAAELSRFPSDKLPILILLEDFPSMNDDFSNIWYPERFEVLLSLILEQNVPVTVSAIPSHYVALSRETVREIISLNATIAQNGLSHKDELSGTVEQQKARILQGREILENVTGIRTKIFIPPYYRADQNTAEALKQLGFNTYISTRGDGVNTGSLSRLDQSISVVKNWAQNEWVTHGEWVYAKRAARSSQNYFMTSLYYFQVNRDTLNMTRSILTPERDEVMMTVTAYEDWAMFRKQVRFFFENDTIFLYGPDSKWSKELVLLVSRDRDYSFVTNYDGFRVKNVAGIPVRVCLNAECYTLDVGSEVVASS
ncbi:MAG: DUF2334 domain-containing protein [Candidatus Woesearchaeota archaeon]